ncbi:hypothetical protein BKA67DRAFT_689191 [Truncatella angustata]|uniref:Uncharacterized protein n=1 Tax=Truncatella angustata TaxID=152316 RepID=A0A9P8UTD8_9PEZI|nr:uncharacterized protein BKA67DRAFT_689191 [Truncatella angustata]KAH6657971.1 hypothetical protein BKA67DRAFT_689191 [Truncatella angustata]KAH8198813.1 hypothetical protein TruAng_007036 [Truncatella angustata]
MNSVTLSLYYTLPAPRRDRRNWSSLPPLLLAFLFGFISASLLITGATRLIIYGIDSADSGGTVAHTNWPLNVSIDICHDSSLLSPLRAPGIQTQTNMKFFFKGDPTIRNFAQLQRYLENLGQQVCLQDETYEREAM